MVTVARAESARGDVVLRRRERDGALELRVNGAFVMDDRETSSERALARLTLQAVPARAGTGKLAVLVAGLGLGYTLAELLADERVGAVLVCEVEPAVIQWHRDGVIPGGSRLLADPRVQVALGDIARVLPRLGPGRFDAVLLDVDNGPDFLVFDSNATLYRPPFLECCRQVLRPDGVLAVWSSTPATGLTADLTRVFGSCREIDLPVTLGARSSSYRILIAEREDGESTQSAE